MSGYVSKLAESGTDKVEAMQSRLQEEHSSRLQHVSSQLADARLNQQQLQQQLTEQRRQHEDRLAESHKERQEECKSLQLKVT